MTSTQWVEYHVGTKRKSYNTLPTSNITTEAVTVDGFTLSQTDNAGVTTTNGRSYTATGMIQTRTDGRSNTTTTVTDKAGRTLTVTDAAGVRTLSYNAYGEQESDSLAADNVTLLITDRVCLQIAALDLTRSAHPTHGIPTAGNSLCFTPVVPWYSDELNNYVTP